MFKLVISDDEGKQTVVPLVRDEITIGRKEGNTIRLTERNVSRRHARLVKANGSFVLEDLHSYNGVKVNGERIGAETTLAPGDQVTIGDYQLALQADAAAKTSSEQAAAPAVSDVETALIATPGPPARIVMITPPSPGAEFPLTSECVRIGRAEDLDVWVNHRSISREHAEIQKEPDGGLRLIDLGSANGVRVNNADVQNALLTAGDVIELGSVRFRFVGAGEHYAFDADRTVQMDALPGPSSTPMANKMPLIAAAVILVMALLGAILVAVVGGGDDDELPIVPTGPTASDGYQDAVDNCSAALRDNDVSGALEQATIALTARPGDQAATACQERAEAIQADEQIFNAGVRHLEEGELEEAYFQFDSLPEDSPLRDRPEVRQTVRSLASVKLNLGRSALEDREADEAMRLSDFVLNMIGLTPQLRQQATDLRSRAQSAGATVAVAPRPRRRGATTGRRRGGDRPAGGGGERRGRRRGETSGGGGSQQGGTTQRPDPPERPPQRPAGNPEAEARQCTMRGDNACVIRLLEGRPRLSPNGHSMLIEAYRARGQTNQALRHMRTFVQRHRSHPRARAYEQILNRH